jgi:hypothetical protein
MYKSYQTWLSPLFWTGEEFIRGSSFTVENALEKINQNNEEIKFMFPEGENFVIIVDDYK